MMNSTTVSRNIRPPTSFEPPSWNSLMTSTPIQQTPYGVLPKGFVHVSDLKLNPVLILGVGEQKIKELKNTITIWEQKYKRLNSRLGDIAADIEHAQSELEEMEEQQEKYVLLLNKWYSALMELWL